MKKTTYPVSKKGKVTLALEEVIDELQNAVENYPSFNTAHEGYAILLEEVDELWDEVKVKQNHPDREKNMRKEAIQVVAMALRFIIDCCEEKNED